VGDKDFDLDINEEDPDLLELLSSENALIESINEIKSDFKGVD
jgi:hypothetical protein